MLSSMRKNPLEKKPYPPGEHGRGRHRQTEFGHRGQDKAHDAAWDDRPSNVRGGHNPKTNAC